MRKIAPKHLEIGMVLKWSSSRDSSHYRLLSKPHQPYGQRYWAVKHIQIARTTGGCYAVGDRLDHAGTGWTGFLWADGKARVMNEP